MQNPAVIEITGFFFDCSGVSAFIPMFILLVMTNIFFFRNEISNILLMEVLMNFDYSHIV